ncbi:leucine-rich repeat-containing protein 2 [Betta splendens]|uniref:Leucine-rich repeat-containing protein 2 n=1 Tax=Betta splendens TaxID=158456 RepID=A0A6P7NEE5_BETSP|nr:leucine-rich repeat-containing protein 2 [Betta splendens]XP_029016535.1 leucine-rich repeat-containing protein 2 [Betta splendens]
MGLERRLDAPVYDLSLVRGIWEVRVKKYRQRQRKEEERVERSALARIDQEWQYRIYCKKLNSTDVNLLHRYLQRATQPCSAVPACTGSGEQQDEKVQKDPDPNALLFQLDGERWLDFPKELQWMTYVRQWHIRGTRICRLPDYLALFSQLTVLDLLRNSITELPPEIGKLSQLRQLNVSYNHLSRIPPQLGNCEKLERLELAGNSNLCELPFELSSLKQLVHLDIAENRFVSIPICALRMSSLQLLDLSNNSLSDLPQDMDRLQKLETLFIHKNKLSYLPFCLTNISTLQMVVVSGEELTCIPTRLCSNPSIKFIRLYDNQTRAGRKEEKRRRRRWQEWRPAEVKDSRDKEFLEAYVSSLMDRDAVPYSTTKVSVSCLL